MSQKPDTGSSALKQSDRRTANCTIIMDMMKVLDRGVEIKLLQCIQERVFNINVHLSFIHGLLPLLVTASVKGVIITEAFFFHSCA